MQIEQPVPELPVRDVNAAQVYYRDRLGFEIAWHNTGGRIGAVSQGPCAIFLRETDASISPVTLWFFAPDVDGDYARFTALGAHVADPLSDKPWGLRQFTLRDPNGHLLHFHHDL